MNGGGAEREGDTESETGSRLRAVSPEPDAGLELADREIVTWWSRTPNRLRHPGAPRPVSILEVSAVDLSVLDFSSAVQLGRRFLCVSSVPSAVPAAGGREEGKRLWGGYLSGPAASPPLARHPDPRAVFMYSFIRQIFTGPRHKAASWNLQLSSLPG